MNADAKRRGMRYIMWTLLGDFHSERDRDHRVLHPARAEDGAVPELFADGAAGIRVLPALRIQHGAGVPELQTCRGAGLEKLPGVRNFADDAGYKAAGRFLQRHRMEGPQTV